jgi:gas vesicle protein
MANYASSALAGAGTGAAAGSVAGPWGALIGAGVGTLAGLFSAYEQEQDTERKKKILDEIKQKFNMDQQEIENLMAQYYDNPENFLGTKQDVDEYKAALKAYSPEDFVYDFNEFKFTDENGNEKTVDDFVNPYYDKIIDDTSRKVAHSAAGAGLGRGTGAANAIAEAVAQKDDELYKTALQQYNTNRQQSYNEWAGNIQAMQNKLNQLRAATDTKMNNLGGLAQDYTNTQKQRISDELAAAQNKAAANMQLATSELML